MAGIDASANLGGMLSQIGGTLGGMGQAGQGLMQPIMTSFRPQLDPNSVESLQRQAAFQGRIGDTEQARLFTGQALALEEKQKEEAEKQRILNEGQARVRAINAYTTALASEDDEAIQAAQSEAMSVGYAQGVNMMPSLTQAEERFRSKKNQAFAETERVRLAKERAENLAVDKATQAMSAAFNKATTEEELEGLLQSAGPLVAQQASILYNNNISRLEANRARAEREAERNALFEAIDVNLIPSDDSISPAKSNELRAAVDSLNKSIEGFNSKVAGKKLIPQSERRNLDAARNNLLQRIYGLTDQVGLIDYRAERDRKQQLQTAVNRVLVDDFSSTERKEAMVIPGAFNDLTEAQAIRLLRNKQLKALLGAEDAAAYVQYEKGDPAVVLAGLSKPGNKKPSISAENVTVESTAPVTNRAEERNEREEALLAERRNIIGGDRKRRRMPETQQRLAEINAELESLTSGLSMPQANFYGNAFANDPFLQQLGAQSNLGMPEANFYSNAFANDPALNPQIRGRGQRRQ